MNVVVVTPPQPDIDLTVVKNHCRVDHDDDDALLELYVAAACSHIDGPGGQLGRCIWPQGLEYRTAAFGSGLVLPYGPVTAVGSVGYVDSSGDVQTISQDGYVLLSTGVVVLAEGATWPTVQGSDEAIVVAYEAGYDETPAAITAAVMLMVGDLYMNRETVTLGSATAIPMSTTVQRLLNPYYRWSV